MSDLETCYRAIGFANPWVTEKSKQVVLCFDKVLAAGIRLTMDNNRNPQVSDLPASVFCMPETCPQYISRTEAENRRNLMHFERMSDVCPNVTRLLEVRICKKNMKDRGFSLSDLLGATSANDIPVNVRCLYDQCPGWCEPRREEWTGIGLSALGPSSVLQLLS